MGGPEVLILCLFAAVVLVTFFVVDTRRRREADRTAFYSRLLDRVGSVQDLNTFLASASGGQLLSSLSPESSYPGSRILSTVRWGTVLAVLAITLFIAVGSGAFTGEMGVLASQAAVICLGLGLGLLAAAGMSYVLGRRMGLLR
jgi:hypothetical protein